MYINNTSYRHTRQILIRNFVVSSIIKLEIYFPFRFTSELKFWAYILFQFDGDEFLLRGRKKKMIISYFFFFFQNLNPLTLVLNPLPCWFDAVQRGIKFIHPRRRPVIIVYAVQFSINRLIWRAWRSDRNEKTRSPAVSLLHNYTFPSNRYFSFIYVYVPCSRGCFPFNFYVSKLSLSLFLRKKERREGKVIIIDRYTIFKTKEEKKNFHSRTK